MQFIPLTPESLKNIREKQLRKKQENEGKDQILPTKRKDGVTLVFDLDQTLYFKKRDKSKFKEKNQPEDVKKKEENEQTNDKNSETNSSNKNKISQQQNHPVKSPQSTSNPSNNSQNGSKNNSPDDFLNVSQSLNPQQFVSRHLHGLLSQIIPKPHIPQLHKLLSRIYGNGYRGMALNGLCKVQWEKVLPKMTEEMVFDQKVMDWINAVNRKNSQNDENSHEMSKIEDNSCGCEDTNPKEKKISVPNTPIEIFIFTNASGKQAKEVIAKLGITVDKVFFVQSNDKKSKFDLPNQELIDLLNGCKSFNEHEIVQTLRVVDTFSEERISEILNEKEIRRSLEESEILIDGNYDNESDKNTTKENNLRENSRNHREKTEEHRKGNSYNDEIKEKEQNEKAVNRNVLREKNINSHFRGGNNGKKTKRFDEKSIPPMMVKPLPESFEIVEYFATFNQLILFEDKEINKVMAELRGWSGLTVDDNLGELLREVLRQFR